MDISDSQLQASLERTARRRAEARDRQRRQMRNIALAVLAVVVVLGALVAGIAAGGEKAMPPEVVAVTWPHGENQPPLPSQFVANGATLLIKNGQPLRVSLPDAAKWDASWRTPEVQTNGDSFDWTPTNAPSTLTVSARAKLAGWKKLLAWRWPSREITLKGIAGKTPGNGDAGGFLHEVEAPDAGLWLHNRVMARKALLRYDDRALKVLGEAAAQLDAAAGDAATATSAIWQLIPAFDGGELSPGDTGTNALLKTENPAQDAREAFKILDRLAPKATIKVIVEEGSPGASGEARFRLSFDDKGGRFVWVQAAGADKATPQDWWND
jgi:hypothetical protein